MYKINYKVLKLNKLSLVLKCTCIIEVFECTLQSLQSIEMIIIVPYLNNTLIIIHTLIYFSANQIGKSLQLYEDTFHSQHCIIHVYRSSNICYTFISSIMRFPHRRNYIGSVDTSVTHVNSHLLHITSTVIPAPLCHFIFTSFLN